MSSNPPDPKRQRTSCNRSKHRVDVDVDDESKTTATERRIRPRRRYDLETDKTNENNRFIGKMMLIWFFRDGSTAEAGNGLPKGIASRYHTIEILGKARLISKCLFSNHLKELLYSMDVRSSRSYRFRDFRDYFLRPHGVVCFRTNSHPCQKCGSWNIGQTQVSDLFEVVFWETHRV